MLYLRIIQEETIMAKRINKINITGLKNAKKTTKEQTDTDNNENGNISAANSRKPPKEKINFEIENIEFLLQKTLSHWKENLDSENIKADTIGDLEKLIKLRLLLIDENEQKRLGSEKMMIAVIGIIREVIEDPTLRIKLLNRLKEIEIGNDNIAE